MSVVVSIVFCFGMCLMISVDGWWYLVCWWIVGDGVGIGDDYLYYLC